MKLILENFRKFVNEEEIASIAGQDMPLEALYDDVLDKIILVLNTAYGEDNYNLYKILTDLAEFHARGRISEVHSEKQRNYMCAMADEDADRPKGLSQAEAAEMCTGPMKEEEDPDADSEKDEAHSAGVRDGQSGADRASSYGMFQRFYDAGYDLGASKSQEDALVLKGPKVDPLGDSLAARRLRAIARRKAGDK